MKPRTVSQMSLLPCYSPPIASPSEGRAGALCQLGRSSSATETSAQKTSGCDPHISATVPETIHHPLKARALVGVLHSLCTHMSFRKVEKKTPQTLEN